MKNAIRASFILSHFYMRLFLIVLWLKVLHQGQWKGRYGKWEGGDLLILAILCVSFSCQERKIEQDSNEIEYSVDTLNIDSKDQILDLRGNLMHLTLADKGKSFFLLNHFSLSIDEIDLDRHVFVNNHQLEPEGPNGVGEYIFSLQSINDSLFFTKSIIGSSVFDRRGRVIKRINWLEAADSNGMQLEQIPTKQVWSGTDDFKVFGINFDSKDREVYLDVLSVRNNTVKRFDIDPENSYHDFIFSFDDNVMPPDVHLSSDKNYVRISHEYSNEIILFNPEGEFVRVVHYEPKMTPKRAKIPGGPEIKSRDQVRKEYQRLLEQVRFEAPVWDNVNNRYFRLSSKRIFADTYDDESFFVPVTKETIVFLSIFDADFNLIKEIKIDE